ncbi:hypothetical protein RND81_08G073900 [Saponaria officinalis]|uniref:Exostosin GT47 domain-containing protein n=1 Tax=Saponaria officinalis TaxID=3572 RepID=A0AAW1J554_SAPOF
MANSNTTSLLLLSTFLILIFIYFNFDFHQNQFIDTNLLPNPFQPSSNNNINNNTNINNSSLIINYNQVHHANIDNISFYGIIKVSKPEKKKNIKSDLEKIEDEMARARASIRKATRNKNYTSEKEETFVPRGHIYRNPYAFHQSHIEMEKRLKIWVYKEGEAPLVHQGPVKGIYGIEGTFIEEIENGLNKFIAKSPNEAHLYFLPISVVQVVVLLYRPFISFNRGPLHRVLMDYANVVAHKYPFWNRSSGADHFMVSCHDWAPEISDINPKFFENLIRGLCNANTSEGFQPNRDVSIPEVNIPASHLEQPSFTSRLSKRKIFAFFAGGVHGLVRRKLFTHWKDKDPEIQVNEYLSKDQNYYKLLGQSKFCLCPSGYEVASPRIVEAIFAECVPVLIKDNYSLPFNDVLDWAQFSVYIPVAKIPEIKAILKGISSKRYLRLVDGVRSVKRHFSVNKPAQPFDLIHMVLHSVWLRRLNVRLPY